MADPLLPPRYDPRAVEDRVYAQWRDAGCFRSAHDASGAVRSAQRAGSKPYVIAIPPPNVTGRLHMGHALNNVFQDILVRFKRMDGRDALWIPGTDHAGIATQTVVKKLLDSEGTDYRALGREKFTAKVWKWKAKYGDMILRQLARIGSSCDWERTRFTMDETLSRAVRHAFKRLFEDGLIYKGQRIVNWCPVDRTALSDDEIETREGGEPGFLWEIKYPLADGSNHLVVATTRPETMFGDVAVAVNAEDERYKNLIGKKVIVPLMERIVPIIVDNYVDMSFGTGCLKITPAHDPNDFEIGKRHNLLPLDVMTEDGRMNGAVPERFQGLDRFACREKVLEELRGSGLLAGETPRMTPVGRSYRSKAVIEYRLSAQWFVRMRPLAEKALALHDRLAIRPERWNKVYLDWLANIRDWCISRQIWWGHRIPVWYCENYKNTSSGVGIDVIRISQIKIVPGEVSISRCDAIVSESTPIQCPACGSKNLTQDPDVLDTWFSSALWPMSILGWPEDTPDFRRYFPTTTLVTAKDIIFFWVARMNMMSAHFTGKLPYENVFINPIVLDEKGETMSKSKGNGIDPLVVTDGATLDGLKEPIREARPSNMKELIRRIEKAFPQGYEGVGADALRWTLVYLCSGGQQIKISLDAFHDLGRRFLTKLWNAARFILMNAETVPVSGKPPNPAPSPTPEDLWIKARIKETTAAVRACLDGFDFTNLGETLYRLAWNDFCDWYVELSKVRLGSNDTAEREAALANLFSAFTDVLSLLHPVIPFITEELWQTIVPAAKARGLWTGEETPPFLLLSPYPRGGGISAEERDVVERFGRVQDVVGRIRTLRKAYGIKDAERLEAWILPNDETTRSAVRDSSPTILRLAGLSTLVTSASGGTRPPGTVSIIAEGYEIYLAVADFLDTAKEKARLEKERERLDRDIAALRGKLGNAEFVARARPELVASERARLSAAEGLRSRTLREIREVGELAGP